MSRWNSKFAAMAFVLMTVCALGAQTTPAGPSPLTDPNMRRVGDHLKCLCGCKATVTGCDMMECRYSSPARKQISAMLAKGEPDNAIYSWFAKQNGLTALLAPPTEGFYAVGWVMPFVGLLFGFLVVYYVLRRYRQPAPIAAAGGAPALSPQQLDRYRQQIDRDLAKMDE